MEDQRRQAAENVAVERPAMADCSEIGTIIGRPQANESFPGSIEGYDVQASSKGRSTAETKT
jgi:hypothetical protein